VGSKHQKPETIWGAKCTKSNKNLVKGNIRRATILKQEVRSLPPCGQGNACAEKMRQGGEVGHHKSKEGGGREDQ